MKLRLVAAGLVLALMAGGGAPPLAADDAVTELEDAKIFHAVAGSIVRDLKLGLPGVSVEVVDGPTFAQVLANWERRRDVAWEARRASAVALGSRIVVQADVLAAMSVPDRATLYAHELAHVAQGQLQLGGSRAKTWLLEGHAEWVSHRVVEQLGYRPYTTSREIVQGLVGRTAHLRGRWPALSDLETTEAWIRTDARFGWSATYGQAFLAVDRLVNLHGADKLHQLFQKLGTPEARLRSLDSGSPFGDAFGERSWDELFLMSYRDFVEDFRGYLQSLK